MGSGADAGRPAQTINRKNDMAALELTDSGAMRAAVERRAPVFIGR